jgi:hypothetical protein
MISAEKYSPVLKDKLYPKLIKETVDWHHWWTEQRKRCIEGYKPIGGTWITGAHYFYLNFCKISAYDPKTGRKRPMPPSYRDQDHEYFTEIQKAKEGGYGIIVLKARRKGFSFMNANILLHDWTFFQGGHNGVGAQKENYVRDFQKKLTMTYMSLPKEIRRSTLHINDLEMQSGYKTKEDSQWIEKNADNLIHFRTMDKPDAFRGTELTYMVFEEAGEFRNLKKAYFANEECFREGDVQFGVPIIGGTSNQLGNESEDYMEMYYDAENYNLKPLFIPASKVYYPYYDNKTGVSDTKSAEEHINKRRADKKKAKDKSLYYAFLQEMPLKAEDAFMNTGATPFDIDKINQQKANILTNTDLQIIQKGRLEWGKNDKDHRVFGKYPEFIPDKEGHIKIVHEPLPDYKNAHVAGVDPYHVDDALDEDLVIRESKGCMVVHRKFINMEIPGELPVCMYADRPYSKEEFYENCLKIAVFYDTQILVEYNDDGFLKYFIDNKMTKYLKERPRSADSPWSQVTNKYGISMKSYQKSLATELLDEYIKKQIEQIYYPELLTEMSVFGSKNTDRVMAFGIALIHNSDNARIVKKKEEDIGEKDFIPHFQNNNGTIVPVYSKRDNFVNRNRKSIFDYGLDIE